MIVLLATAFAEGPADYIAVQEATMPDGLRVVAVQQVAATEATLVAVVDGGAVDEPIPGLAGTAGRSWYLSDASPVHSVADVYERMGAKTELLVTPQSTVFITRVPTERLPDALSLEWGRYTGGLLGVDELASWSPTPPSGTLQPAALRGVFQALYGEDHPYRRLWREPTETPQIYEASSWMTSEWRPDHAMLLIVSPLPPGELLCGIEPRACQVQPPGVIEGAVELPEPTMVVSVKREHGRKVRLEGGVESPTLLAAWALSGVSRIGSVLPELAREQMEAQLRREVPEASCSLYPGLIATALLCSLPSSVEEAALQRSFKKGWAMKKLEKPVQTWRLQALTTLEGTSTEPGFPLRLALWMQQGGAADPYAGALQGLAFDDTQLVKLLKGEAAFDAATWVRLTP